MNKQQNLSLVIKVCGLTRPEDVRLCLDLGAAFTGFIFVPGSPRRISPRLAGGMPSGGAFRVGVFAGQPLDEVLQIMREARLDFAQLHGDEDPVFCRALGAERVIKVLWPERLLNKSAGKESDAMDYSDLLNGHCERFADSCAYFLLDAGFKGGGSGKEMPRQYLRGFSPTRPWLLAGGISPSNAAAILSECAPHGLDCNSGVEATPGIKDPAKLKALFSSIRPPK